MSPKHVEAAEKYWQEVWSTAGGAFTVADYVNAETVPDAFLAGIAHLEAEHADLVKATERARAFLSRIVETNYDNTVILHFSREEIALLDKALAALKEKP